MVSSDDQRLFFQCSEYSIARKPTEDFINLVKSDQVFICQSEQIVSTFSSGLIHHLINILMMDLYFTDAASGGTFDWAKGKAGIKYAFTPELRPASIWEGGFNISPSNIIPSGKEIFAGVVQTCKDVKARLWLSRKINCKYMYMWKVSLRKSSNTIIHLESSMINHRKFSAGKWSQGVLWLY